LSSEDPAVPLYEYYFERCKREVTLTSKKS